MRGQQSFWSYTGGGLTNRIIAKEFEGVAEGGPRKEIKGKEMVRKGTKKSFPVKGEGTVNFGNGPNRMRAKTRKEGRF